MNEVSYRQMVFNMLGTRCFFLAMTKEKLSTRNKFIIIYLHIFLYIKFELAIQCLADKRRVYIFYFFSSDLLTWYQCVIQKFLGTPGMSFHAISFFFFFLNEK